MGRDMRQRSPGSVTAPERKVCTQCCHHLEESGYVNSTQQDLKMMKALTQRVLSKDELDKHYN